jgi:hypothetical protein
MKVRLTPNRCRRRGFANTMTDARRADPIVVYYVVRFPSAVSLSRNFQKHKETRLTPVLG